tara:strand:- start:10792 stop:11754 length:963 start_codon:yes stop_codon:yes gene_type:complete
MGIGVFVKYKNSKKIFLGKIIFLFFILLSSCGDLVKESESAVCNKAIDSRNYDEALSTCSNRKDIASAYMGKAGYDIVNLLKSSSSSVSAYTAPSGVSLGTDDVAGATVLNILQIGVDNIEDYTKRKEAITKSKEYLDNASSQLQKYLTHDSSPLNKDEILLNTFAIAFAMQLDQVMLFDNETTSTSTVPIGAGITCTQVTGYNTDAAKDVLIKMDGHLWSSERNGMQCARVKEAYDDADDQAAAAAALANWVVEAADGYVKLPDPFYDVVCPPFESLTEYLTNLALNIAKLSLSGDNTKAITEAQTSSDTLLKTIGCFE